MVGVVVSGNSQRVVDMFLVLPHLLLVIVVFLNSFSSVAAIPQCAIQTHALNPGALNQDWVFTAPPRFVPAPPVDPNIQAEFYKLFQFSSLAKQSMKGAVLPAGITQTDLDFISSVCPRDAFFYSMSPQHVQARDMLQRYLTLLPTPMDVVHVAKIILYNHAINPKIWYYALMGAVMDRPDMSGVIVPQPLDAIPDLFVPAPIISETLSRYRFEYGIGGIGSDLGGGGGVTHIDRLGFGPLGAASFVNEHRVKFDRALDLASNSSSVADNALSSELTSAEKFAKRRRTIIKKRVKVRTRTRSRESLLTKRNQLFANFSSHDHPVDNAGESSISVASQVTPNSVIKDESVPLSTSTSKSSENQTSSFEDVNFGMRLTFGEDDDEYDELKRIHDISSNNTKLITQRILQRRQRRKQDKKRREKRQIFGSPLHPMRDCAIVNGSLGIENGIENKLWYFREDLMVNQHHWFWHQMYPVNATRHGDRRAELFFFTHRNIVARYNAERLSNGMPRTVELLLKHGSIIGNGYNPNLIDMNSRKFWTPRAPHVPLEDILHEQDQDFARNIFLKDVTDLYFKLLYSIKDGALLGPNQQPVPIRNFQGIDLLANTIEATELSLNPLYYDSIGIHNLGHQILGLAQDPQFIAQLPTGVMADTAVTMRDPVFYTFHSGIDNIFDRYKRTLPPYQLYGGDFPLVWTGVAISAVEILPTLGDGHINKIRTFWSMDRFPLESGIDNSIHNGEIREDVCATHLNHEPFSFKIIVNVNPCTQSATSQGTMRIFMAPRYDEFGHRFPLKVQRRLMFQLDAFPVQLHSGRNVILRRSFDSSLTKPWPQSLKQQAFQRMQGGSANGGAADFCGCGWPRHLLIPKGNPAGMHFDIFVMVTNFDQDIVQDAVEDLKVPESCTSPYLMCGVPWRRYPDQRPMGYPFDRMPYKVPVSCGVATGYPDFVCKMLQPQFFRPVETLEEYVHAAPNMGTNVIVVQHVDTLIV